MKPEDGMGPIGPGVELEATAINKHPGQAEATTAQPTGVRGKRAGLAGKRATPTRRGERMLPRRVVNSGSEQATSERQGKKLADHQDQLETRTGDAV